MNGDHDYSVPEAGLLIERLRAHGCQWPPERLRRLTSPLVDLLARAEVFLIDGAARRAEAATAAPASPLWSLDEQPLRVIPPCPVFFMEFARPTGTGSVTRVGLLADALDLAGDAGLAEFARANDRSVAIVRRQIAHRRERAGVSQEAAWWGHVRETAFTAPDDAAFDLALANRPERVRWWLKCVPFVEVFGYRILGPDFIWHAAVTSDGGIMSGDAGEALFTVQATSRAATAESLLRLSAELMPVVLAPSLIAVSLMARPGARLKSVPSLDAGRVYALDVSDLAGDAGGDEWPDLIADGG
jgi:hypothetical protein